LKLKTYLRMAQIPFEAKPGLPFKGPTKHIPYIDDEGQQVGDSSLIIAHLKSRYGDPLDAKWSAAEHARGHALRQVVEGSLYWGILCVRWLDDAAYREIAGVLGQGVPALVRPLVLGWIRSGTKKKVLHQGVGHLPEAARLAQGKADLDTVSAFLGEQPYVLGDAPSSYDATVYGHVANLLAFPLDSALKEHAQAQDNLVRYCARVRERYWQD